MNFPESEKLICVDSSPPPAGDIVLGCPLAKDTIFVVRDFDPPQHSNDPGGVRVVGNSVFKEDGQESWWRADRFRRLSDIQAENRANSNLQEV